MAHPDHQSERGNDIERRASPSWKGRPPSFERRGGVDRGHEAFNNSPDDELAALCLDGAFKPAVHAIGLEHADHKSRISKRIIDTDNFDLRVKIDDLHAIVRFGIL